MGYRVICLKINIYKIYLIFLNITFWLLIIIGVFWLFLLCFFLSIINANAYMPDYSVITFCKTAAFVAICTIIHAIITFSVHYLRWYVKKRADKNNGKDTSCKIFNFKEEITDFIQICIVYVFVSELAALWPELISMFQLFQCTGQLFPSVIK